MTNTPGIPISKAIPITNSSGAVNTAWFSFFVQLWQRSGGGANSGSQILDTISSTVGSILYRGAANWMGLGPASQYKVLREGASTPEWDLLDGNSFPTQGANEFFAGPSIGVAATAGFRGLVSADLAPVAGAIPGVQSAVVGAAGNVGEYASISVPVGSAVALTTTVISDVGSVALTEGDWDVWGLIAYSGAGAISSANAWLNTTSSTDPGAPNNGAYYAGAALVQSVGKMRVGVPTGGGTIYLSTKVAFTSTINAYGFIGARRVR